MTDEERLEVVERVRAKMRAVRSVRANVASTAAREVSPVHRRRARVAAHYARLYGVTLTEASYALDVPRALVSAAWDAIYPSVPRPRKPDRKAVGHMFTVERYTSKSWVDDDNAPAVVVRWVCSCGMRGQEHHHTHEAYARGHWKSHVKHAERRDTMEKS